MTAIVSGNREGATKLAAFYDIPHVYHYGQYDAMLAAGGHACDRKGGRNRCCAADHSADTHASSDAKLRPDFPANNSEVAPMTVALNRD